MSQTQIRYLDSPLSVGRTSRVASGDRLPYVKSDSGSNSNALQSLGWQMRAYGAAHPELEQWSATRDLPLQVSSYNRETHKAGLTKDALYLVRPDGYIGLAAPVFAQKAFDAYAERWLALNVNVPELAVAV